MSTFPGPPSRRSYAETFERSTRGLAASRGDQRSPTLAIDLARRHPRLITAVYKKALRPTGHVLVDYNQNAWGRTLASIYSVRPTPRASASTPVTWDEVGRGVAIDDFRLDNVPARLAKLGDLWAPLFAARPRVDLSKISARA